MDSVFNLFLYVLNRFERFWLNVSGDSDLLDLSKVILHLFFEDKSWNLEWHDGKLSITNFKFLIDRKLLLDDKWTTPQIWCNMSFIFNIFS